MKKYIVTKSLFAIRMLVVVLCVICGAVPAWAGHGGPHYASVSVTASGQGKVYMTTNKDYAPGSEDWQTTMSENWNCNDDVNNETDSRTYYVHAQANSGYHFVKWSSKSDGSDSKSTNNPYAYSTSASGSSGSPTANNIYAIFEANPQYTCTFLTSTNGTFKYQYGDHEEVTVTSEHSVTTDQNFTFTALPYPGYQVYGWYTESGGVKTYFDYSSNVLSSYALPGNIRIGVDFMPVGSPIFQIKGTTQMFTDLNAAVTACGGATKTIVLVNNGTLPAGDYTIPSNVTLLIPFDANYTCYTETPGTIDSYTSPAAYRTLTMSPGAHLTVNGAISLSAKLSGLSVQGPNGAPSSSYGAIKMLSEGDTKSTITLNSGGKLYCWGYIYGEGEVEALSGSTVHEGFNFMDFRGAQNTYDMNSDSHKVFPFNQYYIQNIEVPLTIHYGATEKVFSCLYPGGNEVPIPITMVGSSDGLFRLTGSGSKLTKWYDPHDDRQHYALEGNAAIRNISFTVTLIMSITVNSANFVLPITNNMDIEVRTGANVDIAENVCIMPDASITVEEGATLNIASGKSVYVYDKNAYTNAGTYSTSQGGYPDAGPGRYALGAYIRRVNYSPSWAAIPDREIRRLAIMHTARFKINGTLNATGKIYTTEGGADIYSDTDGAVINLSTAAGTATVTYQVDHHGYDAYYYSIPITSAQLHNADQSYAPTAGSPAGAAWTYKHGHWGWKVVWMLEDGTVLKTAYHYAQPDASWLLSNAPSTSRDPEGTCSYVFNGWNTTTHTENQEVTVVADYTKTCTDYYTITWKSEDGTETLETDASVGSGENTRYNGATPFKPFDTESSRLYTFDGWATEPNGEKVYDIDGTPAASGDAIYYAHFAVTEVVAIVKADDDTTYCTSIAEAFEVVRNTNFTPTIQVWKDASIPALVYNIENYCTLDLNGHTLTSVTSVQSPFKINKSNITFTITDSSESQSGKLSMTSTYGSPIFGLFVQNGNLQLNGGTIEVISGSAITCGVTVNSNCSFTMNGGTIHVVTTNNREGRGVYSAGTVLINNGTVHVEAAGNAYAMKRDGGTFTINNGKFNINGSSSYINYGSDADANIAIKGGYYSTDNRLATVVPSPYIVYDWASPGEPYHYTVAAKVGYTVTFQNTDETTLQTGTWVEGTTPAYAGETPTKPGDTEGAWMLGGWTPDLVPVTEDITYTAVYVPTPPVASVTISGSTTEYIHFDDAWTAVNSASAASTIKLLDDVALASMLTFTSGRNCTFDLNGYTITNTDLVMFNLNKASSTFTLTDSSERQTGKVVVRSNGTSVAYGVLVSKGTFVLHAGTIEAYLQANTSQGVRVATNTSFTMEGGTIDVMTTNAKNGDGVFANTSATVTINGGSIRMNAAGAGYAVEAVGSVTVTGGHFYAAGGTSAACVAGSPTLQGGYYNLNTNLSDNTSAPYYVFPNADETYLYKVAEGYTLTWSTDGELAGEGYTPAGLTPVGTPIVAPTSTKSGYVFAGWSPAVAATMPADNTTYTAQWAVASVTINGNTTLYTDFNTAFTAANGSASYPATITLLQNTTILSSLQYTNSNYQNCTLDLNGYTISSTKQFALRVNRANITFTITDGSPNQDGVLLSEPTQTDQAYGVYIDKGTFVLQAGTIEAHLKADISAGVRAVNANAYFTMNGGTLQVETTNGKTAYAIYSAGTATVTNGKIYVTGSTAYVTNQASANANVVIQGGKYNTDAQLETCVSAPYHKFSLADESPYLYKVAEAYNLMWTTDGELSGEGYTPSGLTEPGTALVAPTPIKAGYTFYGWTPAVAATMPSADTEYTAQWAVASVTINDATTLYTDFNTAWSAANSATAASTLKLLSDITVTSKLTYDNSNTQNCTLDLNGHTLTSETDVQGPLTINNANVTFTITDSGESGMLLLNTTSTSTIFGVYAEKGSLILTGGTIEARSGSATTGAVTVNANGTFTMEGGTLHVVTTNNRNGRGVYSYNNVTINDGTIHVEAAGTGYGLYVEANKKATVNGGKFNISGSTANKSCICNTATANTNLLLLGGWYNTNLMTDGTTASNINTKYVAPGKSCNYHIFDLEGESPYLYKVAEGYTVTFNNYDDTSLQSSVWEKGAIPAYSGTPTKPADAQYTYTFDGWNAAIVPVTANVTYTAHYSSTVNTYTVLWKDEDGTTLETDEKVPYGTTPTYDGATPTKAADEEYVYSFNGWSPDLSSVTGDVTYTASYNTTPVVASVMNNSSGYTLYYTDFDDAFTAAKEATVAVTITLLQDVSSSVLQYSGKNTDCTLDLNGHTFTSTATQLILNVNKEGSTFTITDKTESKLGQMRIVSTRTDEAYGIYIRAGHLILEAGTIYVSLAATTCAGVRAVNANSSFTMNGGTIQLVTTNSNDGYGITRTGGTVTVNDGKFNISASGSAYVTNQANNNYVKIYGGYYNIDSNLSSVCATNYHVFPNSDATYRYKVAEGYTVTFNNYDGTSLQSGLWEKGTTPEYTGATPTKASDASYAYTFNGWTPNISSVTGDVTYTATYTTTPVVASVETNAAPAYYTDFAAAWDAANSGIEEATLTLLGDVSGLSSSSTYSASHDLTLDLNGHTLAGSGTITYLFQVGCAGHTFTVTDGSANKEGKISFAATGTTASYCVVAKGGTFVLNEGTIEATSSTIVSAPVQAATGGTFIMNGGELRAVTNKSGVNSRAVHSNGGTTIINGGRVHSESKNQAFVVVYASGNVTINGGMFYTHGESITAVTNQTAAQNNLNIRGGYYSAPDAGYYNTFESHVKAPYHIFPNSDGTYVYKVAEAYNLTWSTDGDALTGDYTSGLTEVGTPIVAPDTPTKTGYTFAAWSPAAAATMPANDVTYTATWTPNTNTAYTVKHYKENLDGTYPSEPTDTDHETGTTGAEVTPAVKNYTGFTAPETQTVTILADGSRVVEYYYTRKLHKVTWNATENGGSCATEYTMVKTGATIGTLPEATKTGHEFLGWFTTISGGGNPVTAATMITNKITFYARFTPATYTITYKDQGDVAFSGNNMASLPAAHTYGTATALTDGQKDGYIFNGWFDNAACMGEAMTEIGATAYTDHLTLYAQWTPEETTITVNENQTVTVSANTTVTTTIVHVSGTLEVSDNVTLTTTDLILEATPNSSGEIIGDVTATNAYFDLMGNFKARTWYAVAVPWQVDVPAYALGDVSISNDGENYSSQTLGTTFDLIYYDGALRATGASKAWRYIEDDPAAEHIMVPGRAYMIYLTTNTNVIRFKKSASGILHTNELDVVKYPSAVDANYADWNGIANPATFKAYLNVGTTENLGQVYVADTKQYTTIHLNSDQLQVGQPVFVQPITAKTVVAVRDAGEEDDHPLPPPGPAGAPRRANTNVTPPARYEVALSSADDQESDRIIVRMDEDKDTDAYTVGQDLAKMGVSSVVPQMWVNRYNTQLCVNTAFPTRNRADYPLSIFVPTAGEYRLSALSDESSEQATLYLTYDDRTIWNLNYAPYSLSLESGTNTHYGLRIVYAPQTTTGMEDVQGDNLRGTKVLIDDHVFIIRGGRMYSIDGQMIK